MSAVPVPASAWTQNDGIEVDPALTVRVMLVLPGDVVSGGQQHPRWVKAGDRNHHAARRRGQADRTGRCSLEIFADGRGADVDRRRRIDSDGCGRLRDAGSARADRRVADGDAGHGYGNRRQARRATKTVGGTVANAVLSIDVFNVSPPAGAGDDRLSVMFDVRPAMTAKFVAGVKLNVSVTVTTFVSGANPAALAVMDDVPGTDAGDLWIRRRDSQAPRE